MESDHSETEETNIKLVLEMDTTKSQIEDSEDEDQELSTKKHQNSIDKQSEISNESYTKVISDKNNTDEYNAKEKEHTICVEDKQNANEKFSSELNMDKKDKVAKQKDENQSSLDKNNSIVDENSVKIEIEMEDTESKDSPTREPANAISTSKDEKTNKEVYTLIEKKEVNEVSEKESIEEDKTKKDRITGNRSMDTEVVDGLELSVECASDKEELSSENEDKTNMKPRQKTIIIKVKPEESELECSSSEEENSNLQEIINSNIPKIKSDKKNMKRKNIRMNSSEMKTSGSEENQNSDEDYSPQIKKKIKKSPTIKKQKKRFIESKKRRSESIKKGFLKKNKESASEDTSDDENSDIVLPEKTIKNETEEDLSEKESSTSKSESINSEDEEKSTKNTKERRSNNKLKDNKSIQTLKKYLSVAGIKVRSYNDIWADCKTNKAKIKRLKELLEKNGINGRPTLEKCKRIKEKNEKMREISELDVSNIISEGRVTRARRNIDNGKKASTSPRHREVLNTFKRIKTVVDSDSE